MKICFPGKTNDSVSNSGKMSQHKKNWLNRRTTVTGSVVCLVCLFGLLINLQREQQRVHVTDPEPSTLKVSTQTHSIQDIRTQYFSSSSSVDYHQTQDLPASAAPEQGLSGLLDGRTDKEQSESEILANHLPFLRHFGDTVTSFDVTSAQTTSVKLVSPRNDSIYVGDTLHYVIEAKDNWGTSRTIGGDFWMGALRSPHLRAGTTARIVDHDNGTYSMYFVAGWKGDAMLELTLAHPSEAVHWLRTTFKYADHVPQWDGVFQFNKSEEHSKCYVSYDTIWNNMCEYQPKKALKHTKFVCKKPWSLSCDSLTGIYGESNYNGEFTRLLPMDKAVLFEGKHLYRRVQIAHGFISIKERTRNQPIIPDNSLALPSCGPDLPITQSDGYWYNGQWHSLTCKTTQSYDRNSAIHCLKHTNVIFTGDSTTRQWFASLAELLEVGQPQDHERTFFLERTIAKHDINISFIFHPLSTHPKPIFVNFSQVRFEVDVLFDLPQQHPCNHVVVTSPWAHFIMWPWDAYLEWLTHIRDAMLEVKQKCPNLRIIIKSPHAVDKVTTMRGRDYLFKEMMKAMREIFQKSSVMFIDIWDMDYAFPAAMTLHMPEEVINQEIALFLSYLCPKKQQLPSSPEEQTSLLRNPTVE